MNIFDIFFWILYTIKCQLNGRENVGGFMDRYILKFLGAAVSLNLFSIGIANSMMPTNKKVIDRSTGEEIPLLDLSANSGGFFTAIKKMFKKLLTKL